MHRAERIFYADYFDVKEQSMQVFNTLPELIETASAKLDDVDVVSFDVFDTLFIRRVSNPNFVKKPVARYIKDRANELGIWCHLRTVEKLRGKFENQQRQENGAKHPDYEANYDHFMPQTLREIFGKKYTKSLFEDVARYEIEMENAMLVARADIVEFIKLLHKKGKRLFLISDMYLPAKYLTQMAEAKGLDKYFEGIISSADSIKAKASGAAFPLIKKRYKLDERRWMHIGDNPHSDGLKPTEFGIDSYVIRDSSERLRLGLANRYHYYTAFHHFWHGRLIQQLMLPLEAENIEREELYIDGYNFFSYLMGYAMVRLKQRIDEIGIRKIYFCSREGWMFKRCWELMAPTLWPGIEDKVELHYIYTSRLATAQASRANMGLTPTDTNIAFGPVQNKDFTDIARIFGLNLKKLKPFLKKHDIGAEEVISPIGRTDECTVKLYDLLEDEDFNDAIKQQTVKHRDALEQYLEDEGFFEDEHVALVDIGWLGTIQYYLTNAISHRKDKPCVHGFMLAADRQYEYPTTRFNRYEGLIYDRLNHSHANSCITIIKDVVEEICRADHPTLLAYDLDKNGNSKLKFRTKSDETAKKEKQQFEYYTPLHQGVFDGVKRFAAACAVMDYYARDLKEWLEFIMVARIPFARTDEIKRLNNEVHQDDFASGKRSLTKKQLGKLRNLWKLSYFKLCFVPFVRLRYFLKHIGQYKKL